LFIFERKKAKGEKRKKEKKKSTQTRDEYERMAVSDELHYLS